ncbi:MAG: O-antigen ligase family protein [Bacteroidales bacterium]
MIPLRQEKQSGLLLWGILLTFIALNAVMMALEVYYVPLLPVLLFFVALALVSMERFLLVVVFFVPLSIPLSRLVTGLSINMSLPTEPLLAGLLLLFVIKYLRGERLDLKVLRHPVTLAVYFHLAWMFVTSLTSTDLLVSFKVLVSRLWFVTAFYFLAARMFQKERTMYRYAWVFLGAFAVVIVYTLVNHAGYGFTSQVHAHSVSRPFYSDHTSYGASLGLVLPVLLALFAFVPKENRNLRFLMVLLLLLFVFATAVSYTRATWLSILASAGVWVLIRLRVRFEYLLVGLAAVMILFFSVRTDLMIRLEQNRVESSGEFTEHIQSMSNITTDQSNLERINRWSCAWRMFLDKPLFGFGPGTYQFEYGRFQRSYEKTRISTDFGTMGTAHSEYLLAASESGALGLLAILLVMGTTVYTGLRVHYTAKRHAVRIWSVAVLVGLVSYYLHGVMNNFLDTDKISVLFWGFSAMLVAMDVYHRGGEEGA